MYKTYEETGVSSRSQKSTFVVREQRRELANWSKIFGVDHVLVYRSAELLHVISMLLGQVPTIDCLYFLLTLRRDQSYRICKVSI